LAGDILLQSVVFHVSFLQFLHHFSNKSWKISTAIAKKEMIQTTPTAKRTQAHPPREFFRFFESIMLAIQQMPIDYAQLPQISTRKTLICREKLLLVTPT
jgi:hypothetical protein